MFFKYYLLVMILFFSSNVFAKKQSFEEWKKSFYHVAVSKGIESELLKNILPQVQFLPKVIKYDNSQPFKKYTFVEYRKKVLSDYRVRKARKLYKEHYQILNQVAKKYGVQPRFIVALWGIESNFGNNMGGFKVIDSLATLAYDGRRAKFFTKELIHALKIIQAGHASYSTMKGSWAGAMGQTQFMPSSFLQYAEDHNGNGKANIWSEKHDVFASIANYLKNAKWNDQVTWGRKVSVEYKIPKRMLGIKKKYSLQTWHDLGVRKYNGKELPKVSNITASLIMHNDDPKQSYLVYSNYNSIMKWNRSLYFASAVGILSDSIVNK